eukprot:162791_1
MENSIWYQMEPSRMGYHIDITPVFQKSNMLWILVPSTGWASSSSFNSQYLNFGGHVLKIGRSSCDIVINDKDKKISKHHISLQEKNRHIYLTPVGKRHTYASLKLDSEPFQLDNNKQIEIQNGTVNHLVQMNYCCFWLFDITDFESDADARAEENDLSMEKKGNVYSLHVHDEIYHFNTHLYNPVFLSKLIHEWNNETPTTVHEIIIKYIGNLSSSMAYVIGTRTKKKPQILHEIFAKNEAIIQ